ncbi:hypothetical protein COP2_013517 [Malus domestica]
MQSVPTCGVSYGQGYPTHQCSQFAANEDAWGYQSHSQSWDMFSNAYKSDWRDYSNYMCREPQQFQHEGYWQPYEEFYSGPMQPPQPYIQYAQSNSDSSIDYNQILNELNPMVQGSQQEEYLPPSEEFYHWPYQPSQSPQQSVQFNSSTSLDDDMFNMLLTSLNQIVENQNKEIQNQAKKASELEKQPGQIMEFMAQIQKQSELPNSTIENSKEDFEIHDAITLKSAMEVGANLKTSKHSLEVDEELLIEEEEEDIHTERVEQPLPQPLKPSKPPTTSKDVPISFHSNVTPPNVPFPRRFLIPKKEKSEKDIVEAFPKVQNDIPILGATNQVPDCVEMFKGPCTPRRMIQEKVVAGEDVECIKEDMLETTIPKEVELYDMGQVPTITFNLAKSNIPETFKNVVFVIEFLSDKASKSSSPILHTFSTNLLILMIQAPILEFTPLPDHFKYHLPFEDHFHGT